jgi:hypothetical protein
MHARRHGAGSIQPPAGWAAEQYIMMYWLLVSHVSCLERQGLLRL